MCIHTLLNIYILYIILNIYIYRERERLNIMKHGYMLWSCSPWATLTKAHCRFILVPAHTITLFRAGRMLFDSLVFWENLQETIGKSRFYPTSLNPF